VIFVLDKTVITMLAIIVFLSFLLGYTSSFPRQINSSGNQAQASNCLNQPNVSAPIVSNSTNNTCNSNSSLLNSIVIPLVAVSSSGGGEVVNMTIVEMRGSGKSFFEFGLESPLIANETQASFSNAVEVAKNFDAQTTINSKNVDFYYFFDSNVSGVDGYSAGIGAAVGTILLLKNESWKTGVGVTGGVELNGSVLQVGGILDKAKALKSAGFMEFVVPMGESVVNVIQNSSAENCTQTVINGQVFNECQAQNVSTVVPESVESTVGLNVVEVSDVKQAYAQLVGS
jgi:predicted S18 family serine protease